MARKKKRIRKTHLINFAFNNILLVVSIVFFVMFFCVTVWGKGGLLELYDLKTRRDNIITKNHLLLRNNLFHLQEINELKTSRYIEQRARTDLGFVRPNEVVYIIK